MPFMFGLPPMRAGRPRSCASAGSTRMDKARIDAATAGILLVIRITLPEVAGGLVYAHRPRFVAERRARSRYCFHHDRERAERRPSDGPRRANRGRGARAELEAAAVLVGPPEPRRHVHEPRHAGHP